VIPVVETTREFIESEIKKWKNPSKIIPMEKRYELFSRAAFAIAASGTVSVELAAIETPAIIVYKMNPLTMWIARRLVKLKWVSLVNIIANKTIYPELLGADCTAEKISEAIARTDFDKMKKDLRGTEKFWLKNGADPATIISGDLLK
jgi:lipid-A-disaccharide synthase